MSGTAIINSILRHETRTIYSISSDPLMDLNQFRNLGTNHLEFVSQEARI